jgi:hypothetical protein
MHISPKAVKTAVALAVGAGALVAASAVQAVVVFTPVNIPVPATVAGVYVNVVTGTFGTAAATPGWDINPWGTTGLGFFSPSTPTGGAYVISAASTVANLLPGATVGAASTYGSGSTANFAQWNLNSTDNYFGFRFTNESGGTLHYGWAQLSIGATIGDRTLIGLAFESTPNTPITVVPEPGTYALMGLGLVGLALVARRRKQQA